MNLVVLRESCHQSPLVLCRAPLEMIRNSGVQNARRVRQNIDVICHRQQILSVLRFCHPACPEPRTERSTGLSFFSVILSGATRCFFFARFVRVGSRGRRTVACSITAAGRWNKANFTRQDFPRVPHPLALGFGGSVSRIRVLTSASASFL